MAQAIDAVTEDEPDDVVLDLGRAVMDDIDICHHLRNWSNAPIIVLSADGQEDRLVRSPEQGADYVTKPFSMPACWPASGSPPAIARRSPRSSTAR